MLNLAAALLVTALVTWMIGEDPWECLKLLVSGAFGYGEGIGYTLFYTTSFIFTGLAVATAFHAGLFNIGGEGQAYIAGLGVTLTVLAFDHTLPAPVLSTRSPPLTWAGRKWSWKARITARLCASHSPLAAMP